MERRHASSHLTDPELFSLALPAAGEPEPLPEHLSSCLACSRALVEWKSAVKELGAEQIAPIEIRTEAEWRSAEDRTLEALRHTRIGRRVISLRWALTIAACLLLVAILLPTRRSGPPARIAAMGAAGSASELSAQDQADDALLRDVARLSRAEEGAGSWSSLAPEPPTGRGEEDRL